MFQRRRPLSTLQKLKEFCWPSMGWARTFKFIKYRILRMSDSTHKIARGLATGAATSFSPLLGTHFIQAGYIAYLLNGNILASLIGTFVGNPLTFPLMWYASHAMGVFIFGLFGIEDLMEMPDNWTFALFWELLTTKFFLLILPWLIGGFILAVLSWPFYFLIFFYLVRVSKKARARSKEKRLKKKVKKQFDKAEG